MKKRQWALPALSAASAILAKLVSYAVDAKSEASPNVLGRFALLHKSELSLWLVALTVVSTLAEFGRTLLSGRNENRETLQRVLNTFSRDAFPSRRKKNRITMFKLTNGWGAYWHIANRLCLFRAGWHRWKAVFRIRPYHQYLKVYLRSEDSRSQKSATVLRVSDQAKMCEGMAGKVWEEQFYFLGGEKLPLITPEMVAQVSNLEELPQTHPVREYADATNMSDLVVLRSMGNYARHFMGSVIRTRDGSTWGILLLDSEDDKCPFNTNSGGIFKKKFEQLALTFGLILP